MSEVIEEKNTRPRVYVSGTLIILRRAQHRLEQDHGQATRLRMYVSGAHTCTYLCLRADASMHTYTHIPIPHIHVHVRTSALRLVRNLDSRVRKMEQDSCSAAGTALVLSSGTKA